VKVTNQFSNPLAVLASLRNALKQLKPPPDIAPSKWAEDNVWIPEGNAKPGKLRFTNAPYQRGMLDVIKEPGVYRVTYMTGAQLGKTTVQQCVTGYFIAHEPRSQMFVQPSQGDVQTFLETKLRPMLESNPTIREKMAKPRGRDGVNNSRIISFMGGFLMFAWAGSTKTLRGRSAPIIQADEINGFETTAEGDPGELIAQRAASFGDQALRTESSTPTEKGGRIDKAFYEGDQRRYYVPCPHCDAPQYLRWENVMWTGRRSTGIEDYAKDQNRADEHNPLDAQYMCEACGVGWSDAERKAAIRAAEAAGHGWKAAKPFKGHASFHAPELLSTFRDMSKIVQSYLDKIALDDMRSFVNVSLGEPYEVEGDKADPNKLMARREVYKAQVPMGAVYATAGIDAQADRLEVERVGWGINEESWRIDYKVLWGDTLLPEVWIELEDYLNEELQHESGAVMRVRAACVDTGGQAGHDAVVHDWLRGKTGRGIFGIKGTPGWGKGVIGTIMRKQQGKNARKVDVYPVYGDEAKLLIMRRLAMEAPGPGFCHFDEDADEEYFAQLTSEKLVTHYTKGFPVRKWCKPPKARNEALDCRVYAYAALKIMRPDLKRLTERIAGAEYTPPKQLVKPRKAPEPAPAAAEVPTPISQGERPVKAPENVPIVRSKRLTARNGGGGNWATRW
jgi:phage terminase large subunit GpA-like protein